MEYKPEDQYQSMIRAYEALRSLATDIGKTATVGDPAPADAARAFFLQCYHLKDWLKKDPRIKRPQDVEDVITNSAALSLAADLCNSLKHAGLDKPPRSGMSLDRINMAYSLQVPSSGAAGQIRMARNPSDGDTVALSRGGVADLKGRAVATARVVLTIGGTNHDALEVATRCVSEWDSFLAVQGIVFPKS